MDAVRFVSAFVGFSGAEPSAGASGGPSLSTPQGAVEGVGTVCRYVAANGTKPLAAEAPATDAQVDEWLTWASTELSPLTDAKLFKVNDHLASRTFLVGSSLTLADLVVFGVVQPAVVAFPEAQTLHFCNLLRWYDFIQNLAGPAAAVLPKQLALVKPKFQPPVPLPPPAPKEGAKAAAAGVDKAAKKDDSKTAAGDVDKTAATGAAPAAAASAAAAAAASKPAGNDAKGADKKGGAKEGGEKKGEKKGEEKEKKGEKKGGGGGGGKEAEEAHIGQLDIRVGTIIKVDRHPNADALYLEEIDVGEDKPRQVISGLVKFVPEEKMAGRRVAVVCNLKPAKMRDVMSYGMVLCASNETHDAVDPIAPPEGVPNGEAVTVEGFPGPPLEEVNPKKKLMEKLFPDMVTDAAGAACYKGARFMTSKGPFMSAIAGGHVA